MVEIAGGTAIEMWLVTGSVTVTVTGSARVRDVVALLVVEIAGDTAIEMWLAQGR